MSKVLTSVQDVVTALGGTAELSRWAGYDSHSGVSNWISRGIPPSYHLRLTLRAHAEGYAIDPAVFGLEEADAAELWRAFAPPPERVNAEA